MPSLTRNILYYGLIQLTDAMQEAKILQLSFDLTLPQPNEYVNANYFPQEQGVYGYAEIIYKNRCKKAIPLQYSNQMLIDWVNHSAYLRAAIDCSLNTVLTTFENLGAALGLPEISRTDPIKDWEDPILYIDYVEIRLLYATMNGQLNIYWESVDTCTETGADPPSYTPKNFPSPPPDKKPAGTPQSQLPTPSDPYSPPNDGGLTYKPTPPTEGTDGDLYVLFVDLFAGGNFQAELQIQLWAPFSSSIGLQNNNFQTDLVFYCRGVKQGATTTPQPIGNYNVGTGRTIDQATINRTIPPI